MQAASSNALGHFYRVIEKWFAFVRPKGAGAMT